MKRFLSGLIIVFLCLLSSLVTIAFLQKEKRVTPSSSSKPINSSHLESAQPTADISEIAPPDNEILWGEDIIAARDAQYYFEEVKEFEAKFSGSSLRAKRRSSISEAVEFLSLSELAELYEMLRGNPESGVLGGRLAWRFARENSRRRNELAQG